MSEKEFGVQAEASVELSVGRVIVWLVLMVAIFAGGTFLSQAVQPQVASDIALGQLEQSDGAAAAQRTTSALLVWSGPAMFVSMIGLTLLMFWQQVKGCCSFCKKEFKV